MQMQQIQEETEVYQARMSMHWDAYCQKYESVEGVTAACAKLAAARAAAAERELAAFRKRAAERLAQDKRCVGGGSAGKT